MAQCVFAPAYTAGESEDVYRVWLSCMPVSNSDVMVTEWDPDPRGLEPLMAGQTGCNSLLPSAMAHSRFLSSRAREVLPPDPVRVVKPQTPGKPRV